MTTTKIKAMTTYWIDDGYRVKAVVITVNYDCIFLTCRTTAVSQDHII